MRTIYEVSFCKDKKYQAHIVETAKSSAKIARYYRNAKRVSNVLGISLVAVDYIKIGKPIIII